MAQHVIGKLVLPSTDPEHPITHYAVCELSHAEALPVVLDVSLTPGEAQGYLRGMRAAWSRFAQAHQMTARTAPASPPPPVAPPVEETTEAEEAAPVKNGRGRPLFDTKSAT